MCYMKRIGVRELRQNASRYLERVERGETLEVTSRGRPVAFLTPLPDRASARDRLIAEGKLIPARRRAAALGPPLEIQTEQPLSEALREEREDRRA